MELTGPALDAGERYKKIVADTARLDALLVDLFLDWHGEQPERIVLDVDATDGTVEELERIVGRIQKRWPGVAIWLRGDSGFCRDELLAWCEAQGVEYVLGIAQDPRLKRSLELERARQECERTGQAARVFKDFRYRTLDSWSRERRVIGKAEHLPRGANPRFVVTSLGAERMAARAMRHDPPQAAQDRRADPGQRAGRAAVVRRGLPGSGPLRAGVGPSPEPAPALLAAALQPSS